MLTPLPVVVVAMAARKQQGVNVLSHHDSLLMRFWYLMMREDVHQARAMLRSTPTENQQHDADTRRVRAGRKMIGHQRPHGKIDDVPVAGLKLPYLLSSPLYTRQSIEYNIIEKT